MFSPPMSVHEGLGNSGRLPAIASAARVTLAEIATLLMLGAAAAVAAAFLKRGTNIPGSNILMVVFPISLGLALVPRRGAAMAMGFSAMGCAGVFCLFGVGGIGFGALTSLAVTGLLLELVLWRAKSGFQVYACLMLAGLSANMVAFAIRGGMKLVLGSGKPLAIWWPEAIITYPVCGLIAGAISAVLWFRFRAGKKPSAE